MTDGPSYQPPDGAATQVMEPVIPPAPPGVPPGAPAASGGAGAGVPIWVLVVVALAVGLLAGTASFLFARSGEAAVLAQLETAMLDQQALQLQVTDLTSRLASAQVETARLRAEAAVSAAGAAAAAGPEVVAPATPAASVTNYTFVKKVQHYTTDYEIVVDYVQFLTGAAAATAATAHGDESPPPNDYYIVNDNPLLRTFTVKPTTVCIVLGWAGADATAKKTLTPGQFYDILPGGMSPQAKYANDSALYKITVKGSVVTRIEQVYLP